jgi:hypothetical protein
MQDSATCRDPAPGPARRMSCVGFCILTGRIHASRKMSERSVLQMLSRLGLCFSQWGVRRELLADPESRMAGLSQVALQSLSSQGGSGCTVARQWRKIIPR